MDLVQGQGGHGFDSNYNKNINIQIWIVVMMPVDSSLTNMRVMLLCGFKLGDEVPDLSGMGAIFIGHGTDGDFILDYSHVLWVDIHMGHLEIILW